MRHSAELAWRCGCRALASGSVLRSSSASGLPVTARVPFMDERLWPGDAGVPVPVHVGRDVPERHFEGNPPREPRERCVRGSGRAGADDESPLSRCWVQVMSSGRRASRRRRRRRDPCLRRFGSRPRRRRRALRRRPGRREGRVDRLLPGRSAEASRRARGGRSLRGTSDGQPSDDAPPRGSMTNCADGFVTSIRDHPRHRRPLSRRPALERTARARPHAG